MNVVIRIQVTAIFDIALHQLWCSLVLWFLFFIENICIQHSGWNVFLIAIDFDVWCIIVWIAIILIRTCLVFGVELFEQENDTAMLHSTSCVEKMNQFFLLCYTYMNIVLEYRIIVTFYIVLFGFTLVQFDFESLW